MTTLLQNVGLTLAAAALGWTVFFSFVVSPQAFQTLDAGRAKRLIRNTMKRGHPILAVISAASAAAALTAGALGGAVVMASGAALYMLAAYALAPRDDAKPKAGTRKLDTARVVASLLTAMLLLVVFVGIVLIGFRI